jgi:hypothetical protein
MFAPQKLSANTSNYMCVAGMHYQSTGVVVTATVQTIFTPIVVEATIQFRIINNAQSASVRQVINIIVE